jgi:hypothetical protein
MSFSSNEQRKGGILAVANVAAGLCDKVIREKKEEDQRKLVRLHKALQGNLLVRRRSKQVLIGVAKIALEVKLR